MGKSTIEWLYRGDEPGHTINPIRFRVHKTGRVGHYCEKISPGCKFCYSSEMQRGPYLSGLEFLAANKDKGELFLDKNALLQVMRRRKPTTYFWCDMTDLFLKHHPYDWIDECIAAMVASPWHRHMILTKRPENALEYFASGRHNGGYGPDRANYHLNEERSGELPEHLRTGYPLEVWIGVSVEDRERKSRLDLLRKIPADKRFVSFEPLLEDLDFRSYREFKGIDLAIWGGESGPHARECHAQWIRRGMAVAKRANVLNFVKQVGRRPVDRNDAGFEGDTPRSWPMDTAYHYPASSRNEQGAPVLIQLSDPKGGNMDEWPPALRVRELPPC